MATYCIKLVFVASAFYNIAILRDRSVKGPRDSFFKLESSPTIISWTGLTVCNLYIYYEVKCIEQNTEHKHCTLNHTFDEILSAHFFFQFIGDRRRCKGLLFYESRPCGLGFISVVLPCVASTARIQI